MDNRFILQFNFCATREGFICINRAKTWREAGFGLAADLTETIARIWQNLDMENITERDIYGKGNATYIYRFI